MSITNNILDFNPIVVGDVLEDEQFVQLKDARVSPIYYLSNRGRLFGVGQGLITNDIEKVSRISLKSNINKSGSRLINTHNIVNRYFIDNYFEKNAHIHKICKLLAEGWSPIAIIDLLEEEDITVKYTTVYNILNNRSYKDISSQYNIDYDLKDRKSIPLPSETILGYNPINKKDTKKGEVFRLIEEDNIKKGMYYLSNFGRVVNILSKVLLIPTVSNTRDELVLSLKSENSKTTIRLARFVAKYFLKTTDDDIKYKRNYLKYIDGDQYNVSASNLKRSIKSEAMGLMTEDDVRFICTLLSEKKSVKEIHIALSNRNRRITSDMIYRIKYKTSYVEISDIYFQ